VNRPTLGARCRIAGAPGPRSAGFSAAGRSQSRAQLIARGVTVERQSLLVVTSKSVLVLLAVRGAETQRRRQIDRCRIILCCQRRPG